MWNPWKKIRELRRTVELLQENIRLRKLLSEKQAAQGIEVRFTEPPVVDRIGETINSYIN